MKNISLLLIFTLLAIHIPTQGQDKDYSEAFNLVEVWLDAQKDYENIPGLTAIVVEDQEVLWTGAFGLANREDKKKAEPTTLCSICSISKLFTSVAIMKLYEDGKLRLDDRVSDLLPWYNLDQKYSDSGPITVRTLLTHSSGLPREAGFPYWTGPDFPFPNREEIRAKLGEQETLYPASTYFQYSNLGLTLLGEIVEEISGLSYDEYIHQNILTPLNLSSTRTDLPESKYGIELAIGYSALTRGGTREKVNLFQANGIKPAAGYSSNVGDLGKFAAWQFRLRDTSLTEILKPPTLRYMQSVQWTNPDWKTTWGLGFVVYKGSDGNKWVGHGGSCPGYETTLQLNLKGKRAFSVMINANGTSPGKYVQGINAIMNKVKEKKDQTSEGDQADGRDLSAYAGYYSSMPWDGEFYIATWGGQLVSLDLPVDKPGDSMTFFKHIRDDTFRRIRDDGELGETLVFSRDADNQVIKVNSHGNYSMRIQ